MRWLDSITELSGHKFEQTLGDSEGQGSVACCSPWGHKESDMTKTEQQQEKKNTNVATKQYSAEQPIDH